MTGVPIYYGARPDSTSAHLLFVCPLWSSNIQLYTIRNDALCSIWCLVAVTIICNQITTSRIAMTTPQRDDLSPIQDFLQWSHKQTTGRQGTQGAQNNRQSKYIPYSVLETYMRKPNTVEKLLGALFSDGHDAPDADSIRNHWLRPFAILISINHGQMINAFRRRNDLEDEKLPLRREPENFPKSSIVNDNGPVNLWNMFYQRQWEFCPKRLEFNMESDLDENYILPFQVGEKLGRGGSSDIYKITVDEEYNTLSPPVDDKVVVRESSLNSRGYANPIVGLVTPTNQRLCY